MLREVEPLLLNILASSVKPRVSSIEYRLCKGFVRKAIEYLYRSTTPQKKTIFLRYRLSSK